METIYRAFDGTIFEECEECEEYEKNLMAESIKNGCKFFSDENNSNSLLEYSNCDEMREAFYHAYVVHIYTEQALEKFQEIIGDARDTFNTCGIYFFDPTEEDWLLIDELIENLEEKLDIAKDIKKSF